jgi:hypothetical protein
MLITLRKPVLVNTSSPDSEGCLLFVDDRLVAVLVRLEQGAYADPSLWGQWLLEAGFGPCETGDQELIFPTLDVAEQWATERVTLAEQIASGLTCPAIRGNGSRPHRLA